MHPLTSLADDAKCRTRGLISLTDVSVPIPHGMELMVFTAYFRVLHI
jgi:hypothetical protein